MAKNKKKRPPIHRHRNAAPRGPRPPRIDEEPETNNQRMGRIAAGMAGSSVVGVIMTRQGWAPKTVATGLTVLGAGLGFKGDSKAVRSVGAGAMSAAGAQLAMLMFDEHEKQKHDEKQGALAAVATSKPAGAQKQLANSNELPDGALESAFNRARLAMAIGG